MTAACNSMRRTLTRSRALGRGLPLDTNWQRSSDVRTGTSERSRHPQGDPVLARGLTGTGHRAVPGIRVIEAGTQPSADPPAHAGTGLERVRVGAATAVADTGELVLVVADMEVGVDEGRERIAKAPRVRPGERDAEIVALQKRLIEILYDGQRDDRLGEAIARARIGGEYGTRAGRVGAEEPVAYAG